MIPGLDDFHDGMHHHLIHEMQHAANEAHSPPDIVSAEHDIGDPMDGHHAESLADADHLSAAESHAPHQDGHSEIAEQHGGHEHGFTGWLGEAAMELAVDMAAELLSPVLLGANHHDTHHGLHVGVPHGDGFTHQTTGFTCAVVSQKMILDQFHLVDPRTGEPVSEAQLVYDATVNGWLTDHGTSMGDLNKLLEYYGVSSHDGHDWKHLVNDLAAGHQVLISVNADELWHDHSLFSELAHLFGNAPNHAIVLKGLKVNDHGRVAVVVNDPGRADGAGVEYSLEHFQSALDSRHIHYVATDHAPPGWSPDHTVGQALGQMAARPEGQTFDVSAPIGHADTNHFVDEMTRMSEAEKAAFLRAL